ncbi:hypothetical protein JCM8547_000853 [Rhodosporidiobolus lusitaniae]
MLAVAALASLAAAGAYAAPVASSLLTVEAALSPSNETFTNVSVVSYEMNGNAGACGWYSKDSDLVAGLPLELYSDLASASPFCGQYIVVTTPANVTATILIADASATSDTLSLSQGSWAALNGTDAELQTVDFRFANETETAAAKEALQSASSSSSAAPSSTRAPSTSTYVAPLSTPSSAAATTSSAEAYQFNQKQETTSAKATTTTRAYTTSYAPKTTTTTITSYAPKTTTTQAAATKAASNYKSSSSSSSGSSYSGQATFYYQNGVAGACGTVHSDSDMIIALESSVYANGAHCGKTVTITGNGVTQTATVADECPSCVSSGSIDLSSGLFAKFASYDAGVVEVTWHF